MNTSPTDLVTPEALNKIFGTKGKSGSIEFSFGQGGLLKATLTHTSNSSLEVYLYGSHITSWKTINRGSTSIEHLFLSERALFTPGKAIRGGIPISFPKFADLGSYTLMPAHGFARISQWSVKETSVEKNPQIILTLADSSATEEMWKGVRFMLEFTITLKESALEMTLAAKNRGDTPFNFSTALHTYFAVEELRAASIKGLQGVQATSRVDGSNFIGEELTTINNLTDTIYRAAPAEIVISEKSCDRNLLLRSNGFSEIVVWNPGEEKARAMQDLGDNEFNKFLCVEPAIASQTHTLMPGAEWKGSQEFIYQLK